MKKLLTILTLLAISNLAIALTPAIEGDWGTQQSANGILFDMTFSIHNNRLTLINVCSMYGQSATAQVTSTVTYDDTNLTIQEAHQDQVSNAGVSCNVSVQPDQLQYVVQGNQLILIKPGSNQSFVLIRR